MGLTKDGRTDWKRIPTLRIMTTLLVVDFGLTGTSKPRVVATVCSYPRKKAMIAAADKVDELMAKGQRLRRHVLAVYDALTWH